MCIKFKSRKICVAGNECDNSDFDFCKAEHKELPVIKISSCEGREGCQQLKPKGTQASLGTTVIAVTILLILSILFSRVTVNVLAFVLRVVFSRGMTCSASVLKSGAHSFRRLGSQKLPCYLGVAQIE